MTVRLRRAMALPSFGVADGEAEVSAEATTIWCFTKGETNGPRATQKIENYRFKILKSGHYSKDNLYLSVISRVFFWRGIMLYGFV